MGRQDQQEHLPSAMPERLMPSELLAKALVRGNEYAWRLGDISEVVEAARAFGLATLGGQIQFRVPQGTCELYWHEVNSVPRQPEEPWAEYVDRSANEVLAGVGRLPPVADLVSDGIRTFDILDALHSNGENLVASLCMVLYFMGESA